MSKKVKILVGGGVALAVAAALAIGVFEVQTAFIDDEVNETLSADGSVVSAGPFHDVDHAVKGKAQVVEGPDGKLELQLVDFHVDNGPALEMWVIDRDDATDNETVKEADHLTLGPLKGNIGDQAYALPAEFDAGKHKAVVVWCERFGVNFATAPLVPAQ
jgi:hypothetical protein